MSCSLATFVEELFQITFGVKVIFIGMDDSTVVLVKGCSGVSSKRIEVFK